MVYIGSLHLFIHQVFLFNEILSYKSKIDSIPMMLIITVIISHFHVLALNVNLFKIPKILIRNDATFFLEKKVFMLNEHPCRESIVNALHRS